MPMILILERDLTRPEISRLVNSCAHCQRAIDRSTTLAGGAGTCDVLRIRVDLNVQRICSAFEARR